MGTKEWRLALVTPAIRKLTGQLMRFVKGERVGINVMDITVCGAIAQYNIYWAGKLICMLLCSPEVIAEFGRRYGEQTSIIASACGVELYGEF